MERINDGDLSDEDEEALGEAIAEMVDDFGPDFDEEGQPLEEGESDRVKDEGERDKGSHASSDDDDDSDDDDSDDEESEESEDKEGAAA